MAIGGKEEEAEESRVTNKVYTYHDDLGKWEKSLPPILMQRFNLSAVAIKDEIIVAAGGVVSTRSNSKVWRTTRVEVYIRHRDRWYITSRLPSPRSTFTVAVVGDTFYASGGVGAAVECAHTTAFIGVPLLVLHTAPRKRQSTSTTAGVPSWNQVSDDYPLSCSSLVEVNSNLVAVGGSAQHHGTRSIGLYDASLQKWVECEGAQLPVPVFRPGVAKFSESEVMVVGGELASQRFSSAVFIGTHTEFLKADP